MILFVISIVLLLFSAAVTGVALSNNVKGAGIGLIPGLVGLLLLIPACLYSVDVGEVAVIRNMGAVWPVISKTRASIGRRRGRASSNTTPVTTSSTSTRTPITSTTAAARSASRSPSTTGAALRPTSTSKSTTALIRARPNTCTRSMASSRRSRRTTSATICVPWRANSQGGSTP